MNKFEFKNLTPFKWFVLENFPFIEADFDALTEWQLFCKIGKEMNKIINSENTLGTQVENVTNAFIELQKFVNNYFDNLDVQEEINNKLNDMVIDGTLASILTNYTKISKVFNTTEEMLLDNTLEINQKIKTLGYSTINDGGAGTFFITNIQKSNKFQIKLSENKYAELINLKSFKQMGKFNTNISSEEFNLFNEYNIIDLENNTLILTDTLSVENKTIKNGKISMGMASSLTPPTKEICLLVKSNVNIENIDFEDIDAYYTILSDRGVKNINIINCRFINNAFACIVFDVENENLKVDSCYFENIKYTDTSSFLYRYFIATGTKYTKEENITYNYSVRNIEITNNILKNNPLWEGIDTHGGENIIIKNNIIENCQTGIMANCSDFTLKNMTHKNIIIENNIINGTENISRTGIIIGGTNNIICENVKIINNSINKSSENNINFGSIKTNYIKNFIISNNKITNSIIRGINLGTKSINGTIKNNYIENETTAPIVQSGYTIINIEIINNILNGKNKCLQGFYNPLSGRGKMENNNIYGCITNNSINYPNNFNKCYNGSSNAYVAKDDILHDIVSNNPIKVTSNYFSLGKSEFNLEMKATGIQNTNYIDVDINPQEIVEGLEIMLGNDEYTVDYIIGNRIYLLQKLINQYSNITITPKNPTYSNFT